MDGKTYSLSNVIVCPRDDNHIHLRFLENRPAGGDIFEATGTRVIDLGSAGKAFCKGLHVNIAARAFALHRATHHSGSPSSNGSDQPEGEHFPSLNPRDYRALQKIFKYMNDKKNEKEPKTAKVGSPLVHLPTFGGKATKLLQNPIEVQRPKQPKFIVCRP